MPLSLITSGLSRFENVEVRIFSDVFVSVRSDQMKVMVYDQKNSTDDERVLVDRKTVE